jgi:hypothetical protein
MARTSFKELFVSVVLCAPGISLSQTTVAGATPGSFRVTESGAAEYSIPLRVPPGIAAMEPRLALVYNSQAGNGLLGVGWDLEGFSEITRCPRTMAQDGVRGAVSYDANDRYCLDGQRLMAVSGTYGADGAEYRTERESFTKVISYGTAGNGPAWFKAWTKAGQIMEYGNTADSRIEAQGKSTVRTWAVGKISDIKGNYLTISYVEDNGNGDHRPGRLDYTGNAAAGLTASSSVQLDYQNRPDIVSLYVGGSVIRAQKRLTSVKTYAGTALIKNYRLDYVATDPAAPWRRSQLASVSECVDIAGSTCLAPTVVQWQPESPPQWIASPGFTPPALVQSDPSNDLGVRFVDLNGDGRVDVVQSRYTSVGYYYGAWLNTGSGWQSAPGYAPPAVIQSDPSNDLGVRFVDLNGDGLVDVVQSRYTSAGIYQGAWLNTGSGWQSAPGYIPPALIQSDPSNDLGVRFVDLNGDGRVDVIQSRYTSSGAYQGAWLNTGSGWQSAPSYIVPALVQSDPSNDLGVRFVDLNGDGLVDVVQSRYTSVGHYQGAWLNTGSGWQSAPSYIPPAIIQSDPSNDLGVRFVDLNGDGLVDVVQSRYTSVGTYQGAWLNTGSGWQSAPSFTPPALIQSDPSNDLGVRFVDLNGDGLVDVVQSRYTSVGTYQGAWLNTGSGWHSAPGYTPAALVQSDPSNDLGVRFIDLNGDGAEDMVQSRYTSGGPYQGAWLTPSPAGRVASVQASSGLATSISYKPLTDGSVYTKGSGATYPKADLQNAMRVVSSVSQHDAIGGNLSVLHKYAGLKSSHDGRGLLGFQRVESTSQQTNLTARTDYLQDWPYIGLPAVVKKTQSSGAVLSEAANTYSCTNPATGGTCTVAAGNRYFPFVSQSVETGNDLNGGTLPVVTTTTGYDSFGNATSVVVSTGDGFSKTTTNTFLNDAASWLLGRLARSSVQSTKP